MPRCIGHFGNHLLQSKYWPALYTVVQLTELRMVSVWINRKKNIFHGPIPGDMACQPKAWHDVLPMGIVWINYLLMFPFLAGCGHAKFVTSPGAFRAPAGVLAIARPWLVRTSKNSNYNCFGVVAVIC